MACEVNKSLLPVKAFYLWFYAAISSSMPFVPHFLQQKGYSTGDVSTIFAIVPFVVLFSKPTIGNYADKSGRYKCTMLCCLSIGAIFFSMLYFVDPFDDDLLFNATTTANSSSVANSTNVVIRPVSQKTHFDKYQFWIVLILITVSNAMGMSPSYTIMDTVTMNMLRHRPQDFGKQRMWMSVGLASSIFVVSAIMDAISKGQPQINYLPSFIAFVFCILCTAICVYCLRPMKTDGKAPSKGLMSFLPTLKNWKILLFLTMTFVLGGNFGQSVWMTVWYMKELGSSQTAIAVSVAVTSATTMISSFLSGILIRKLGHEMCLVFCLTSYGVRAWLWTLISDPWHGVVLELLTGVAIGLWFATMVSYANKIAPKGSETSSQSVLSGVYDGLGTGVGNLTSGWIYFYLGGVTTWKLFGAFTCSCAALYFVIIMCTDRPTCRSQTSDIKIREMEVMEQKPLKAAVGSETA